MFSNLQQQQPQGQGQGQKQGLHSDSGAGAESDFGGLSGFGDNDEGYSFDVESFLTESANALSLAGGGGSRGNDPSAGLFGNGNVSSSSGSGGAQWGLGAPPGKQGEYIADPAAAAGTFPILLRVLRVLHFSC